MATLSPSPQPHQQITRLEHLADEEALKLAHGIDERPEAMQRSSSRLSMRPSFDQLAVPVAAIGKVNVTDPWGTAWGMDSPYDASLAYSSNPNRITMRQSAYFGSGIALAALASGGTTAVHPSFGNGSTSPSGSNGTPSSLHPQPSHHNTTTSPAPSVFSSVSGSQSGNTHVWSEASSTSSNFSNSNVTGTTPPAGHTAPWVNHNDPNGKRRSVSFQGDLASLGGLPSPSALSMNTDQRSYSGDSGIGMASTPQSLSQHSMPSLRGVRSTNNLPTFSQSSNHRASRASMAMHSASNNMPGNRRTLSTPGTEADRSHFRKSFIGGSVVNQAHAAADLPPVPVDPKVLAKSTRRGSKHPAGMPSPGLSMATSRASIATAATDRTDALSVLSGHTTDGGNAGSKKTNRRKSWFARSPSSNTNVETLSTVSMSRSGTRQSIAEMSARPSRPSSSQSNHNQQHGPPPLSRASSSFMSSNQQHSPPPPTPSIPDTLPLPPSSLGERNKTASSNSLRTRINASQGQNQNHINAQSQNHGNQGHALPQKSLSTPTSRTRTPSPGPSLKNDVQLPTVLSPTAINAPTTPHSLRHKTPTTPSLYGTPLASPTSSQGPPVSLNGNATYATAPTTSSPLSMSPMTSPTSASSLPLKPAASSRSNGPQLPTHAEDSIQPTSFPSPGARETAALLHKEMRRSPVSSPIPGAITRIPQRLEVGNKQNPPISSVSLPPTPIYEEGPNSLAPAALIKPSPSSPPAFGLASIAAGVEHGQTNGRTPSTRAPPQSASTGQSQRRASPGSNTGNGPRPVNTQDQHLVAPGPRLDSAAPPRSSSMSSQGSAPGAARRGSASQSPPPSATASRKASAGSMRVQVEQAPLTPEASTAVVEHVSQQQQQQQQQVVAPATVMVESSVEPTKATLAQFDASPAVHAVPHQPALNMGLSSFAVRKPFPLHATPSSEHVSAMPMLRKGSAQSIQPDSVPLPASPALSSNGFETARPAEGQPLSRLASSNERLIDDGLRLQPAPTEKTLKPRASSPNLAASSARTQGSKGLGNGRPPQHIKPTTPARKTTFGSMFKRSRSKTVGEGTPFPPEMLAEIGVLPPHMPPMPAKQNASSKAAAQSSPASAQMTPVPTPQLSFSSSTTSTIAGSEPSDQFYADFAPAARPSFSTSSSSQNTTTPNSKPVISKKKSANLNKSNNSQQMQQSVNSTPLNKSTSHNKSTFGRMFGAKRKA